MKKVLFCLIAVLAVSLMIFSGCNSVDKGEISNTEVPTNAPTEYSTDAPTEAATPYWKINGRSIKSYAEQHFAMSEDSDRDIMLEISSDWELERSGTGYSINRSGKYIGSIFTGGVPDKEWTAVESCSKKIGDELKIEKNI